MYWTLLLCTSTSPLSGYLAPPIPVQSGHGKLGQSGPANWLGLLSGAQLVTDSEWLLPVQCSPVLVQSSPVPVRSRLCETTLYQREPYFSPVQPSSSPPSPVPVISRLCELLGHQCVPVPRLPYHFLELLLHLPRPWDKLCLDDRQCLACPTPTRDMICPAAHGPALSDATNISVPGLPNTAPIHRNHCEVHDARSV